jgi:hypothetical protein
MNLRRDITSVMEGRSEGPERKHPVPSGSVDYRPVYDEEAMRRFEEEGTKAWADVPDAAAWVREIRGGAFGAAEPSPSLSQRERGRRKRLQA